MWHGLVWTETIQAFQARVAMNHKELIVVANAVKEWKNPRCWAWHDKYRLPLTQGLIYPQYG